MSPIKNERFIFKKENFCILPFILILTFISFLPVLKAKFVWDDSIHIMDNVYVQSLSLDNIKRMFTTTIAKVYIPMTTLSFAVEYHFFRFNYFIIHLNNLFLHVFNVAMVFLIGQRMKLSFLAASVAALIFGLHPMHVESVAWASERKDVLYAAFYLLSIWHYINYCETKRFKYFLISLALGCLSILSKAMALSLPLVLLLIDWYWQRKIDVKAVFEKICYFFYIVPIALITYLLHARNPIQNLGEAFLVYAWSFVFYIQKFFFPLTLLPLYDSPKIIALNNPVILLSVVIFISVIASVWIFRRKRLYVFAWGFYYFSIFFILRMDVAIDLSIVADRFMYLPSVGFCYLIGAWASSAYQRTLQKPASNVLVIMTVVILICGLYLKTFEQTKIWNNELALWNHEVAHMPDFGIAYHNRGVAHHQQGMTEEALADLNKALEMLPKYETAYYNRAIVYVKLKEWDKAIRDLNTSLLLDPQAVNSLRSRAYIHYQKNDFVSALSDVNSALVLELNNFKAYKDRANIYAKIGNKTQALKDYKKALAINPFYELGYVRRGNFYFEEGQEELAMDDFNRTLQINPRNYLAYTLRGVIYRHKQQFDLALKDFNMALRIKKNMKRALVERAVLYEEIGETELAKGELEKFYAKNPQILEEIAEYEY